MSNVIVDKNKIDILANAISAKSGEAVTMTLDEMVSAVDGIETGGGITPTGNIDITSAGVTDVTNYATATVPQGEISVGIGNIGFYTENNQRKWRCRAGGGVETGDSEGAEGYIADHTWTYSNYLTRNAIASGTSVTPTESAQTIGGNNYMMEGAVTVNAIPSNYVGSGITRRTSSDMTKSGSAIVAPAGYYASNATMNLRSASLSASATKGSVSNHAISVTPTLTVSSEGYVNTGSLDGTAVTVSASELVSGTYTVDSSGTKDVTNYASASVPAGTAGTPSASKGTVSNHSVSVTPSVTNTTGWITGSTKSGTAVTVTASELASGNKAITQNGTGIDVVGYSTVSVNVAGAEYTRTVVCPQQTVSSNSRTANLANFPDGFIAGDYYIVTYDGTEYLLTAETMWSSAQVVGDFHIYYEVPGEYLYPFAMGSSGSDRDIAMLNTSQHTVKVEHLELITGGTTLTTKSITANGTYNASSDSANGYSSVTVNVPTGSPTIQSLTVAPSTTQQIFNASGVDGYKPVTVSAVSQTNLTAENIKNGTTVTISNGTSNIYSVTGTYSGGSSKNVQVLQSTSRTNSSSLTKVLGDLTVSKTGTYDIYWSGGRSNTSTSYTWGTRLYVDGSGYGTENTTWTNNCQSNHLSNVSLTANQKLSVYARGRTGSYYTFAPMLVIVEA